MPLKIPSPEMITAISAVVIGMAALYVTADQAHVAREQADIMRESIHASIWPVVQIKVAMFQDEESAELSYTLQNSGVGPAVISGVRFASGDTVYPDMSSLISLAPPALADLDPLVKRSTISGGVIAPGDSVEIMSARWQFSAPPSAQTEAEFEQLFSRFRQVHASSCYCSAMNRCWQTASDDRIPPQRTEACDGQTYGDF